ncbi:MAG: peptidylprolyl isomerase [Pantoea sp. Brub]|nr:peptidylprolyl isomerase [Pantoea sp. Brub]
MMDNLNKPSKITFIKVTLVIVILVFVLSNIGIYLIRDNDVNYSVKVNNEKIRYEQVEQAFDEELKHQQNMLGNLFYRLIHNTNYLNAMHKKVLDNLINSVLFSQYIHDFHFTISDDQIKQVILSQEVFQDENGIFSNSKYKDFIHQSGLTANQYVELLRDRLSFLHVVNSISNSDFILKSEINKIVDLISQKRIINTAVINVDSLTKKQKITDAELHNYYELHKNTFIVPENIRIDYIHLNLDKLKPPHINESEINDWYHNHKQDYSIPEVNHYSVIQTKNKKDADNILNQLKHGADFKKLAKLHSTDLITASKGGDLGWLEPSILSQFTKTITLNKKGQISDVINSSIGFLILRLDDLGIKKFTPLLEVRDFIIKKLQKQKVIALFFDLQKIISREAHNHNDSLSIAQKMSGLNLTKTGWFDLNHIPKELNIDDIKNVIYNMVESIKKKNLLTGERNSELLKIDNNNLLVFRISNYKKAVIKSFKEVKLNIAHIIKHIKAKREAQLLANKFIYNQKHKNNKLFFPNIVFKKSKILDRKNKDAIVKTVFRLKLPSINNPSWGIAEDLKGNIVLIMLKKVIPGTMTKEEINKICIILLQKQNKIIFDNIIKNIRKNAKITYNF